MLAILAPSGVAFAAALLAFLGVMRTVRQKERTDHREQWWKRVQWAADLVRSADDTSQQVGLVALTAMINEEDEIDSTDDELLRSIIELVLQVGETDEVEPVAPAQADFSAVQRSLRWLSRVLRRASEQLEHASR